MTSHNTILFGVLLFLVALLFISREVYAFSCQNSLTSRASPSRLLALSDDTMLSRREWSKRALSSLIVGSGSIVTITSYPEQSNAADDIIWKTGRTPEIPGQKPKDKGDVKGTKKDPSFLRSVSDCKSKCENSYGPDGLSRTANECLSACQDICCQSYEQCTFAIVPR
jgi:hypothetical protein